MGCCQVEGERRWPQCHHEGMWRRHAKGFEHSAGTAFIVRVSQRVLSLAIIVVWQSASMFTESIDEKAVYDCTGDPQPADMKALVKVLLDKPFKECYDGETLSAGMLGRNRITMMLRAELCSLMTMKGYALPDIVKELSKFISTIDFPPTVRIDMFKQLSDIE